MIRLLSCIAHPLAVTLVALAVPLALPLAAQGKLAASLAAPLDVQALRTQILPSPADQEWQQIPWRSELRAALHEAGEKQLPVLLWAMNGHPLGCT